MQLHHDPDDLQPDLFGDEVDESPPERRIVSAATAPRVRTRAPASVWDMAAAVGLQTRGLGMVLVELPPAPLRAEVTRTEGVVRVVGAAYPSNRWDAEREEQERVRRAKQRPPRPPKGARTRGKKVRQWDGEDAT